jgi:hypothetical protein
MVYDTSIKSKEIREEIIKHLGKPYTILDMFRVGPIGSSRMEIVEYSKLFSGIMSKGKQAVFANIALRPKGIMVIINVRLSNYSWVIPYHYLSIYKTDVLSIHSQGEFLKFKFYGDQNQKLLQKIMKEKAERMATPS